MNGFWLGENDNIYYILLGSSLLLIPIYFLYNNHIYNISITKNLNNITELHEYSDLYLSDIFYSTSSSQLLIKFLDNKYLFNFFKNFLKLYPSPELLLLDFTFEEKREILRFFEMIKKNSFNTFSNFDIKKKVFYKLIYYINKQIFCLDI